MSIEQYSKTFADQPKSADWLQTIREQAIASFTENGFPHQKLEDWKYTSVRSIAGAEFATALPAGGHRRLEHLGTMQLYSVNGDLISASGQPAEGIMFCPIDTILDDETVQAHLGKYLNTTDNDQGFAALNTALFTSGWYLHVDKNVASDSVIEIIYLNDQADTLIQPRNLIVVENNAQVTVIERHESETNSVTNAATEVVLGDNAEFNHIKLIEEDDSASHIANIHAIVGRDSRYHFHNMLLTGLLTRTDVTVQLLGEGSHTTLNGLFVTNGRQHVDTHSYVHHEVPNCTSSENYKGVLDGRSRGVFNGQVVVYKDAQKTNAEQSSKNLLLSPHAEIDTKPQLEIYADDVLCAHGATIGELDQTALFYLKSRGIDEATGRTMLTAAFIEEVIEELPLDNVSDYVSAAVSKKLRAR